MSLNIARDIADLTTDVEVVNRLRAIVTELDILVDELGQTNLDQPAPNWRAEEPLQMTIILWSEGDGFWHTYLHDTLNPDFDWWIGVLDAFACVGIDRVAALAGSGEFFTNVWKGDVLADCRSVGEEVQVTITCEPIRSVLDRLRNCSDGPPSTVVISPIYATAKPEPT